MIKEILPRIYKCPDPCPFFYEGGFFNNNIIDRPKNQRTKIDPLNPVDPWSYYIQQRKKRTNRRKHGNNLTHKYLNTDDCGLNG